jgi:NAD(P)-dependent dehydrogenase (short-subunit alcohol dehydrogenase family)
MAVVLITGTSSGIGLATAVTLARAGHTVIATMRNPDPGGDLLRLAAAKRLPITTLALDVDEDVSITRAFESTLAEHGRIDVLVNNAGIGGPAAIEETPLDFFRRVMETNYFGALRCIKAVLPGMLARRVGCIINVSSLAGRLAIAPQAAYAASKHALEALSECLAQEVKAFNIRVALVEPGPVATPIMGRYQGARASTAYPQRRRMAAFFAAHMKTPTGPEVVAEQIRWIVEGDSWQLRYPVGSHAAAALRWRAKTSDEDWVSLFGGGDAEWAAAVKRELGLDVEL